MPDQWPDEIEQGLILTDNAMGIMTSEPSPAGREFIALAASASRPLLEIGAAYGNVTIPALKAGGTVIANDLSASELHILLESTPPEHLRRLIAMPARFPDDLHFADGSLSGVLASQVLHFLDGTGVERAFSTVHRWLEPGGAFFVVVITPDVSFYSQMRPEYDARCARGERWPGIFNPRAFAPPDWADRLPPLMNLFQTDVLARCATEAGFLVEKLEYFCFENFPDKFRCDGREFITLTARKPGQG